MQAGFQHHHQNAALMPALQRYWADSFPSARLAGAVRELAGRDPRRQHVRLPLGRRPGGEQRDLDTRLDRGGRALAARPAARCSRLLVVPDGRLGWQSRPFGFTRTGCRRGSCNLSRRRCACWRAWALATLLECLPRAERPPHRDPSRRDRSGRGGDCAFSRRFPPSLQGSLRPSGSRVCTPILGRAGPGCGTGVLAMGFRRSPAAHGGRTHGDLFM